MTTNAHPGTERLQQLNRMYRMYRTISRCNHHMIRAESEQTLAQKFCSVMVEEGSYRMAWVGYAENDEARSIRPIAHAGLESGYLENLNLTWADTDRGSGPGARCIREQTVQVTRQIASDPRFVHWREEAAKRGYTSSIALPLKIGTGTLGFLGIYSERSDAFDEEEIGLLTEAADDLAYGINALRNDAELRQLNGELEHRVSDRTAQLEAANRELQAFDYSVAHDLRAPLVRILGFGEALLEGYSGVLDARANDYLHRVIAEGERMDLLIHDLLQLATVSRTDLRRSRVDVSSMAQSVCEALRAGSPGQAVTAAIQPGLFAEADPGLLRIALENLLGNAWKFSSRQESPEVAFGAASLDGRPAFFVRDNGVGFDPAAADQLFAPFRRLHRQADFAGTGIGLATVSRIITRHGGHVRAWGAVGQGATFTFTLGQ